MDLAITKGADFLAFTRNAKAITLPDGVTVLGPLVSLPHRHGDYAIRAVNMVGDVQAGNLEPPVVEGDVVVLRRSDAKVR